MRSLLLSCLLSTFSYLAIGQSLDSIQTAQKNEQYKHLISLELPALMVGTFAGKYERKIKKRMSLVARAGIIGILPGKEIQLGLGSSWEPGYKNEYESPGGYISDTGESFEGISIRRTIQSRDKGFFLRIGPKWMFSKRKKFQGFYFHPSLFYTRFTFDREHFSSFTLTDGSSPKPNNPEHWTDDFNMSSAGLLLSIGLQLQLTQRLVIDGNLGLGAAYHGIHVKRTYHNPVPGEPTIKEYTRDNYEAIWYSHFSAGVKFDAAINLGFSVGIAL